MFAFLSSFFFFAVQKRPIEWQIEITRNRHFSGVQGSLEWQRNKVAPSGCLDAILVFLLKTTSFESWPTEAIVMSIQP